MSCFFYHHIVVISIALVCGAGILHTSQATHRWEISQAALNDQLLRAAAKGKETSVKSLLDCGANLYAHGKQTGWTALHYAVFGGYVDLVAFLLEHGADPCQKDFAGETPLHLLVCTTRPDVCRMKEFRSLQRETLDIARGHFRFFPLDDRVHYGDMDYQSNEVMLEFDKGITFMRNASVLRRVDYLSQLVALLVAYGADINTTNREGKTPLYAAAEYVNVLAVALLISKHASCLPCAETRRSQDGLKQSIMRILERGEQRENRYSYYKQFNAFADYEQERIVRAMLADNYWSYTYEEAYCAMYHMLVHPYRFRSIYHLQEELDARLCVQAARGNSAAVKLLVDLKANLNADHGRPLIEAASSGNADLVAYMLDHNADSTASTACTGRGKETPLTTAIDRAHVDTVKLLLERGADASDTTALERVCHRIEQLKQFLSGRASLWSYYQPRNQEDQRKAQSVLSRLQDIRLLLEDQQGDILDGVGNFFALSEEA